MKKTFVFAVCVLMTCGAFAETYEKGKTYGPITILSGSETIDGNGAVIDAKGLGRCATLGPNVTLKNFTFKNGKAAVGGGVYGGKIVDCTIENCTATEYGAALVKCAASGKTTITGCRRVNDGSTQAAVHGGIVADATLTGCTIKNCRVDLTSLAPGFGALGANSSLSGCTVTDNTLALSGDHYGTLFYNCTVSSSTVKDNPGVSSLSSVAFMKGSVTGCTLDTAVTPVDPTPDDPNPPSPITPPGPAEDYGFAFDATTANWFTTTCSDSAGNLCAVVVTTAKRSVKGATATVTFTAKVTVGSKTYSYSGGKMVNGVVTVQPTCRTKGAPTLGSLAFGASSMTGSLDGMGFSGSRETSAPEIWGWDGDVEGTVGCGFRAQVRADSAAVKFTATGLPSGLKINATTGEIAGVPKSAKTALVKVTATSTLNKSWKTVFTQEVVIRALPAWVAATYVGGGDGGFLQTLKVAKTGKVTGKWLEGGKSWTISAAGLDAFDVHSEIGSLTLTFKSGKVSETVEAVLSEEGFACELFEATRSDWKAEPWKSLSKKMSKKKLSVDDGFGGLVDLTFSTNGKVTAKVTTADDYKATAKAVCSQIDAEARAVRVYVYLAPKKNVLPDGYAASVDVQFDEDGNIVDYE